jgi:hypothetical protein
LYDGETWINFGKYVRNTWKVLKKGFEMCYWKTLEKIGWTDHVKNDEVLQRVEEERNILDTIKQRKACAGTAF